MPTLIVIPTPQEYVYFIQACEKLALQLTDEKIGRMACKSSLKHELTIACGGLGKVQFGISTQHLIDCGPQWQRIICAGAGGGMVDNLSVGDIVVGTATVEYDIKNHFGPPLLPRFSGSELMLKQCREAMMANSWPFQITAGPVASGDQDVVDVEIRAEIVEQTGAKAVAWEGAGGARACQFSEVPFLEIRGISDGADDTAASSYEDHLEVVMHNLALYLLAVCKIALENEGATT